ncbi:MAG: hypothetical protein E7012_04470 [Alphaproteobacteria bacterium]|nr:hypothetical protein [Alphaproteobacteria bacterium]
MKTQERESSKLRFAYKIGNEILLSHKLSLDNLWGFEIARNLVVSKDCQPVSWQSNKEFANNCFFDGRRCHLPSKKQLDEIWQTTNLIRVIYETSLVIDNGKFFGEVWSEEGYSFSFVNNHGCIRSSDYEQPYQRLVIAL